MAKKGSFVDASVDGVITAFGEAAVAVGDLNQAIKQGRKNTGEMVKEVADTCSQASNNVKGLLSDWDLNELVSKAPARQANAALDSLGSQLVELRDSIYGNLEMAEFTSSQGGQALVDAAGAAIKELSDAVQNFGDALKQGVKNVSDFTDMKKANQSIQKEVTEKRQSQEQSVEQEQESTMKPGPG